MDNNESSTYFTSWLEYTDNVVCPSFDDFATWRQWFYPANKNTEFTLSPDCSICESEAYEDIESPLNQNKKIVHLIIVILNFNLILCVCNVCCERLILL